MQITLDELKTLGEERFDAERIRSLRKSLHLSASKFAQLLHVSARQVQRWESGESDPRGASLVLLELLVKANETQVAGPAAEPAKSIRNDAISLKDILTGMGDLDGGSQNFSAETFQLSQTGYHKSNGSIPKPTKNYMLSGPVR